MLTVLARYGLRGRKSRHALRQVYLQLRRSKPFQGAADDRLGFAEFLSFDAFDTLITRPVFHPSDVFLLCAIAMRRRGMIATDAASWRALRYDAERHAAVLSHPVEAKPEAIYEHLVMQGALAADRVTEAIAIERDMEQSITRPIAQTIEAVQQFRAAGGRVCVISDTVLPQADICRLLQRNGMVFGERAVLTSSQAGSTKRSGALFRVGVTRLGASPPVMLHIGDNLQSDVRRAKEAGLSTAPFLTGRATRFELCLHERLWRHAGLASVMAGTARAIRLGRSFTDPRHQAIWDTSAGLGGPLLFSFVAWTLWEAVRHGLTRLYFPSHDGDILLKVAAELQPALAPVLDCRSLDAPQSLHLLAIVVWSSAERQWALDVVEMLSLREFVGRLNLALSEFLQALPPDAPLHFVDPDIILGSGAKALLGSALDIPAVQALILHRANELRQDWLASLQREGPIAPDAIGIVDIGSRGRLRQVLGRVLGTHDPGCQNRMHSFCVDHDVNEPGALSTFSALCNVDALSAFDWSTVFQTLGAAAPHEGVRNEAEAWGFAVQQDGIMAFAREAMQMLNLADIDPGQHVEPLAQAACALTRMFVETPSPAEVSCFGHVKPAGTETHSATDPISVAPPALWTLPSAIGRLRRVVHQGEALARSMSGWFHGPALRVFGPAPRRHL